MFKRTLAVTAVIATLALLTLSPHAAPTALAAEEAGEWVNLFDGKTTNGWTPRGKVEKFDVEAAELVLLTKANVWVTTDVKMKDFEAELQVLTPEEADFNSGLAFRCQGATGKPKGYQVEIENAKDNKSGGIYGIGLGGWLYPAKADEKEFYEKTKQLFRPNEWNQIRLKCVGPRIQTWLNGQPVSDITSDKQLEGYFGIQHHGHGGEVHFRNIRVREIK